ncbi:MAG TPA: iron-sulfur cluster assembly scaffold protein, partial [Solirubrobacterales bacterium]|nr:iron-sulfur cluster assembly scaffold protein [Solirubrobacterales bacterium]
MGGGGSGLWRSTLGFVERELFEAYLRDESRFGPVPEDACTGAAGGAACGDLSRISLRVADGRIDSVSVDTEGCGATKAATAAVAEMVDGAPVLKAALIDVDTVDAAIGGLTPAKRHAAQLATDALHRALQQVASTSLSLDVASRPSQRVAVAMSGGVDSAVAALLAREEGAEVVGITVKLWADPETDGTKACCSPEAVLGA